MRYVLSVTALLLFLVLTKPPTQPNPISDTNPIPHIHFARVYYKNIQDSIQAEKDYQFNLLTQALIWVESRNNPLAVQSRTKARGILQIMPIYIAEVNRILKSPTYKWDDAFDRDKSLKMFHILQAHHNPQKDLNKALLLHNPRAFNSYFTEIQRIRLLLADKPESLTLTDYLN